MISFVLNEPFLFFEYLVRVQRDFLFSAKFIERRFKGINLHEILCFIKSLREYARSD